uniref:G-protein coupled receptor GRL101-like n=1 Tax=Crassostrea virginica TaxID=6565 RepID=A0A8B8E9A2_CRAVI|nr:G-protein coupled receptor GRL101-like [Crassostrea virginica]
MEISLSMQHRCLRYEHMVLGKASLVVGYITELSEMYDLRYISNTHPASSFLKFRECKRDEFRCNRIRDECIPESKICDLELDCVDGEDERFCGFLTFSGFDVTAKVYSWVIVVVLPINSALNPVIYTFSAILRRRGHDVYSIFNKHRSVQSIDTVVKRSLDLDFADSIIKKLSEYDEMLVLATTSFPSWESLQINDVFSMEIPLSMQHRCLTYEHMVLGESGLVVGYITELSEMYDLRYISNTHPASSFLKFSRSSALMPIGFSFKVVFRSMYEENAKGLILVSSISITDGMCGECKRDEFRCNKIRDECIPESKLCDLELDCVDAEDEKSCDSYTLCCAQPRAVGQMQCSAPINEISSCHNLIDIPLLSVIIWYIAFFAFFGNVLGPFYRIFVLKPKAITSFVIYSINLSFADFLMGVYLYIIAGANLKFSGRYGFEDDSWRQSTVCTFAGVLATLSSEASALFVLAITVDRIVLNRNPFSEIRVNTCVAKLVSLLIWFISLLLAVTPLFGNDYFNDYYSSSGICISLPLSVVRKPGWEYSMIIFVGANFIIFIGILLGQFLIFADVVRLGKDLSSQRNTKNSQEINLTKTLIAVAITDMLCWIPLGVIGFLTFSGFDVTVKVYSWVIVVVLPINSALNPVIYTFAAMLRRRGQNVYFNSSRQRSVQSIHTVVK